MRGVRPCHAALPTGLQPLWCRPGMARGGSHYPRLGLPWISLMRAVDAIIECLKAEGVDAMFGIPGGANLPTYDAIYDGGITHIHCRHEQGAGHAAEGYAKASGKVGVALGTSGPGATNLVTAIADAIMDSVPTVF